MSAELHERRWIEIEGVANMRDLGGLPTSDGGSIAWRRLIRSDSLQDLSPEAVDHLVNTVGVRDIIDLRSETELQQVGSGPLRLIEALTHHHHSLLPNQKQRQGPPDDTGLGPRPQELNGRRDATFWADSYLRYLTARPDSVSACLDAISRSGATIVHCAAGKDRTGTVVAMALSVAGVPDEIIIQDYVLSAQRITRILDRLNVHPLYGDGLKSQPVDDQQSKAQSMRAFLELLRKRFGSVDAWLRDQGWIEDDLDRLRARLRAS